MIKFKKKLNLITILSFVIGISFAIGYSYYNKAVAKEQITTSVSISNEDAGQLKAIVLDVAQEGLAKKWLQPNELIARYGIKNEGKESMTIKISAIHFTNEVIVESGSPGFDKPSADFVATINPGKTIRFKVRIRLPNANLIQTQQHLGVLQIVNQKDQSQLGVIPVYAINSYTQGQPIDKISTIPDQHEGHKK